MLKKFGMEKAKHAKTPMASSGHLDLNEEGKTIDQKLYRSMIGSLLYLCASRPDIMLSVCACVPVFKLTRKSVTVGGLRLPKVLKNVI
jgi:hypothetical protein